MKSITITHKGKRKTNQDLILIKKIDPETNLYMIADGMGGYDDGELAAQISLDNIETFLSNVAIIDKNTIQKAVNKANLAIRQFQEQNNSKLGATLGGVIISKNIAKCFWIGDVKIIHFSKNKLLYESKSHNLLNEFSDNKLSNNISKLNNYSHIVTRSIQGDIKKSVISYQELIINKKEKMIICSDGVHSLIDSQTMLFLMNSKKDNKTFVEQINDRLINYGDDNSSLIYIN